MSSIIPITLTGENLGKRHLHLNSLVNEAYKRNEDFGIIENLPEKSPIDRLFKIDLASKMKNVNFIIKNLKNDDMLYVSRALKSKWLISNEEFVNPRYLEEKLYPEMITTAKTKMQHWVHINLNDEKRSQDFYEYYLERNFNLAIKFLVKCSRDVIENEFPKVMHKINPNNFKILCEKSPRVAEIFFDLLATDEELKSHYLEKQKDYFKTLKYLLKTNGDLVLDINEKYFNKDLFRSFSPAATEFIIENYKQRFMVKPELYTVYLLHLPSLAERLTIEESKELVVKLARAKYLADINWFNYKKVEPFIKRLKPEDRAAFKKKVFVNKDIGVAEKNWPYPLPAPPECKRFVHSTIFDDKQPDPESYGRIKKIKRQIKKKRGNKYECVQIECCERNKTLLDRLFDEFRFISFGQTLYELRKRILAESSPQNREFMLLVLVSKTGGRPDAIASLLQFLTQHINEPPNVRAAIIRSLVKRSQVWRLPEESWSQLLQFGQDLGLDGKPPIADCVEGLHAVVIRSLLLNGKLCPEIQKAFLSKFSYFSDYSLSATEKKTISELIPNLLLTVAKEKEYPPDAVYWLDKLIETLNAFNVKLETFPGLIDIISEIAEKCEYAIAHMLINLFQAKVARKQLLRYTFQYVKTDASYVNALRHDLSVIDVKLLALYFTDNFMQSAEQFFKKVAIYFNEENGLASKIVDEIRQSKAKIFGRPLAILLGSKLESFLDELEAINNKEFKILGASIRANAHTARPCIDLECLGWEKAGVKLIANKTVNCRLVDIDNIIEKLLKSKKTVRVALALSRKINNETEVFLKLADIKPNTAIKSGIKLIMRHQNKVDVVRIWEKIKPIIQKLDIMSDKSEFLVRTLAGIGKIPLIIRPDYSSVVYTLFKKKSLAFSLPPLCHVEILLPDVDESFIEDLLQEYLTDEFVTSKFSKEDINDKNSIQNTCLFVRVLIKFLFLCKNVETQTYRWEKFGKPFLAKMEEIFKAFRSMSTTYHRKLFPTILDEMFLSFKYNRVFLNIQYVSPLPVMENTLLWIQKLFPLERHFKMYAKLHLIMLYSKAVRQGIKLYPDTFSDERKTQEEGEEIVGYIFGKYIVREVKILIEKYFNTITELYATALIGFLEDNNNYNISSDLLSSIIKGILEGSKSRECLVGIHLMAVKSCYLRNEHCKELKDAIRGVTDEEVKWFAFLSCLQS